MSLPAPRVRRVLVIGLAFAIAAISCGRELTAPNGALRFARGISWNAIFPEVLSQVGVSGTGVVPFTRVHVVLRRADNSIALDTVIDFPASASSVPVTLTVPLAAGAPATGEVLSLNLGYINAAGDTVFRGGPTPVLAAPTVPGAPAPPPVSIPVSYTGPGATATILRISPRQLAVGAGNTFNFSAIASGPSGAIPGTPIVWISLDQSLATISSPGAGAGSALTVRGSVRIVAQLLTGPADTATLIIQPTPANITLVSGNTQTGPTGSLLAQQVTVLVKATDGLPVQGVSVSFAAANGGVVGAATVATDVNGIAQTTWRLGTLVGAQSLTATAAGLTGSPVTFTATATSSTPTKLAITTQPSATTTVGTALAPVVVTVQDVNSNTAATFTGPVTVAFGTNTVGALLSGTTTVNAVAGIATFSTLSINKTGAGFTLVATSPLLTSATSNAFATTAGAAVRLSFTTAINGSVGGATLTPTITVAAVDSLGNTVTTFTDTVRVAIGNNPGGATQSGSVKAVAVAGVASFSTLAIDKAGSGYTLAASATGLITAASLPFDVVVGPAANLVLASGGGQTGPISTALPSPVIAMVTDIGGNGVAGKTVTFATANGTVTPASGVTNALGQVSTSWTLGATLGAQTMTATSAGLAGSPLTINATATAGGAGGPAATLLFTTGPTTALAGASNAPAIIVQARDAGAGLATTFTGNVTLAIGTNPGTSTIGGTVTVAAVGGIATFPNITLNKTGIGYTLTATSGALPVATSGTFNITPAAAANLTITAGNSQSANALSVLPTPLTVTVTDAFTNTVPGVAVGFAITTGGGSLGTTAAVTNAAGQATSVWTLGGLAGAQTVTVTSAGLAGSPAVFTATGIVVGLRTWTGATNTLWTTTTNWSPVGVPLSTDSVVVPFITNLPNISTVTTIKALTLAPSAVLTLNSTLTVNGNLDATGTISGSGGVVLGSVTPASVKGVVSQPIQITNALYLVTGALSANSLQVMGTGAIDINGQSVVIGAGGISTAGSATIKMTQPGSALSTTGGASFAGGSESGLLTTGTLTVSSNFNEGGGSTSAFVATSGHTTILNGTVATNFSFTDPNSSMFGNLIINDPAGITALTTFQANNVTMTAGILTGTLGGTINGTLTDPLGKLQLPSISFASSTTPVSATTPAIIGSVTFNNNPSILAANLTVNGTVNVLGNLQLNGHTLTVTGNFATVANGQLTMNNAADVMNVTGNATFGSTTAGGPMSFGTMNVGGDFTQSGSVQSLSTFGSNTIVLNGAGAQIVNFLTPDINYTGACSTSCFQNLTVNKAGGAALFFTSPVKVIGSYSVVGPGPVSTLATNGSFIVVGNATLGQNAAYHRLGLASSTYSKSGLTTVDSVSYFGGGQTYNPAALSEVYSDIRGTVNWSAPGTLTGEMVLSGTGQLNLSTSGAVVTGNFASNGSATLKMTTNVTDSLQVNGNALFNGGVTTGLLTTGAIAVSGNLTTNGTAFDASGTHRVWMTKTTGTQQLLGNPGSTINGFQDLIFSNAGIKQVQFTGFAFNVKGRLIVQNGSGTVIGGGALGKIWMKGGGSVYDLTATSDQLQLDRLLLDGNGGGLSVILPKTLKVSDLMITTGTTTLVDSLHLIGGITVNGSSAELELHNNLVRITGAGSYFSVTNGGFLKMINAGDSLMVENGAPILFDGGSSGTRLKAGKIFASGNFTQALTTSNASFAQNASSTLKTVFNSGGTQTVTFASPATSFFQDLELRGSTSTTVSLASNIVLKGTLSHDANSIGHGFSSATASTMLVTASGLIGASYPTNFNNVALMFLDGTANGAIQTYNFLNFPVNYTGTAFTVNRTTAPNPLTLTTINFISFTFGTGGKYITNLGSVPLNPSGTCTVSIGPTTGTCP